MAPNPNVNPEFMVENGALKTPGKARQQRQASLIPALRAEAGGSLSLRPACLQSQFRTPRLHREILS